MLKHSAVYAVTQGLVAFISFCTLILYSRLLTPSEYGLYAVVVAGTGLTYAIAYSWLGSSVIRFFHAPDISRETLLSTVALWFVALSGMLLLLGAAVLLWSPVLEEYTTLTFLGVLLIVPFAGIEICLTLLRIELAPFRFGVLLVLRAMVTLGVGALLASAGWGAAGVVCGMVVGAAVPTLVAIVWDWSHVRWRAVDWTLVRPFLRYGVPITLSLLLGRVVASSDRLLLAWLADSSATGIYAMAFNLSQQAVGIGILVASLAATPFVFAAHEEGDASATRERLEHTLAGVVALGLPATVGLSILAPNITTTLFGDAFQERSASVVAIVAVGMLLSGLRTAYIALAFQLSKVTMRLVWPLLLAAIFNVILNILWIPRWNVVGAASASVVAHGAAFILSAAMAQRTYPLPVPVRVLARLVVCTGVMAMVVWLVAPHRGLVALAGQITVGIIAYAVTAWSLNVLDIRTRLRDRYEAR